MDSFKLRISIQFPFLKITNNVKYSEVEKPSGIAYILLVLLNESRNKTENISNILSNFGVPKTLHYLFANTLFDMIQKDIIEFNYYYSKTYLSYNKNHFNNYLVGDFKFTTRGKKIFDEESFPTGIDKNVTIDVFYDVAKKDLILVPDPILEVKPLMDCAISNEFIEQFTCEKNIENHLNLNRGKGIPIKKEEIITEVTQQNNENFIGKYDSEFIISKDNLKVTFEDKVLQNFIEKFYTSEIINNVISFKNKYKFSSSYSKGMKLSLYNSEKIVEVLLPNAIEEILNQKSELLITKGNYVTIKSYSIINNEIFEKYDNNLEFIQVDSHNNIYGYLPGLFDFDNEVFGVIKIPLLLKLKITMDELKSIVLPYINSLSKYSADNFKSLVKVTNITKDADTACKIMEKYLDDNIEKNIINLNEMKVAALTNTNAAILSKYKQLLKDNYFKYLDLSHEDNLDTVLKITSSIPKFINVSPKEILDRIFSNIKVKNALKTYQTLVKGGFSNELVTYYVNPVPNALKLNYSEDKNLNDLINYNKKINDLKKITGIFDFKNYILNEEEINKEEFKNIYLTLGNLSKSIQMFKNSNKELFVEFANFQKIFEFINDDINMLDAALKNPKDIKQELINKKISSGDYQFVFVNLSAKLELILKNKYNLNSKLSNMLSESAKKGLISKEIVDDLHQFRKNRNAFIHPEDRSSNFNPDDLRRWTKLIFGLEA